MTKLADALEGGHSGWRGVPYLRIDGDTDSCERLEVMPAAVCSTVANLQTCDACSPCVGSCLDTFDLQRTAQYIMVLAPEGYHPLLAVERKAMKHMIMLLS